MTLNPYAAETNGFTLSNAVLNLSLAAVTAKKTINENDVNTVAVERDNLLFDVLPSLKAEDSWIKRRMPTFVGLTPALLVGRSSRPLLLCQQCEALPQEYCGPHSRHGHAPHHSAGMSTDVHSDL